MKSIRTKITVIILAIVLFLCVELGVVSCLLNQSSSMETLEKTLIETAQVASERVAKELDTYKSIAFEVGSTARLARSDISTEDKKAIIDQKVETYGFQRGNLLDFAGNSLFDGNNYANRDYFQRSMKGETFVSDPLISKITGELSIIISAPLWRNGDPNDEPIGVVYFVPNEQFLNDIVTSITVGETGSAYMLNKDGLVIAHRDSSLVCVDNSIENAKTDKSLTDIAEIEMDMIALNTGFGRYTWGGVSKLEAYAPVEGTEGWSLGVTVEESEFLKGMYQSLLITIIMVAAFIVIGTVIALKFGSHVATPIKLCAARLKKLAEGDLMSEVPVTKAKDETGVLLSSLSSVVKELNEDIADVSYHLGEMAKGNLTTRVTKFYKGDLKQLAISINKIIASLNDTLYQINRSADQVSTGSVQVSQGAQSLATGTTEQASSTEQLASSINNISEEVKDSARNAGETCVMMDEVAAEIIKSNDKMQEMMKAMAEISSSSGEIGKIIKTIEDIAFQTNILALNAAVEAARAGAAGKGFAVVADEVRNLASKSGTAAKNTTALIEGSIRSVERGKQIADDTAKSLLEVVKSSRAATDMVNKISDSSKNQAEAISQVTVGVDQIAMVVQTNSATAEQSAAASEELSGQAQMLKDLVSHFMLSDGADGATPQELPAQEDNEASKLEF